MAGIMINEITEELAAVTGNDYIEIEEKQPDGSYVTKKFKPETMANQSKDNVDITGGSISGTNITEKFESIADPVENGITQEMVDNNNGVLITLSEAGNSQTLPSLSESTIKKLTVINNDTSTDSIEVNGITLEPGKGQSFLWDVTAWVLVSLGITDLPVPKSQGGTGSTTGNINFFSYNGLVLTEAAGGFTIAGGTESEKTLTVDETKSLSDKVDKVADHSLVADAEISNIHEANKDTKLDEGGENEVAAPALKTHMTTHPAPSTRDARNEAAGTAAGLMSSHTTTHPAPTDRDTRNEAAGTAASIISGHESSHPAPTNRDTRNEASGSVATHASLRNIHGLNISSEKTLTVSENVNLDEAKAFSDKLDKLIAESTERITDYTLDLSDVYKIVVMNKSSAGVLTVPPNALHAFPVGSFVGVFNKSDYKVEIAGGAGVTVYNALSIPKHGSTILRKHGENLWVNEASSSSSSLVEAVEKTADYTLAEDDAGKILEMNITGAGTITVPTDATFDFEIGTVFYVYNESADPVTIAGDSGVTVRNEGEIDQYKTARLRKRAADEWVLETSSGAAAGVVEAVEKTADYTLAEDDAGKILEMNITGAGTITVPADTATDFEIGTIFYVCNMAQNSVTVMGDTGVDVINAGDIFQYDQTFLWKRAANEWVMEIASERKILDGEYSGVIGVKMFNAIVQDDCSMSYHSLILGGWHHRMFNGVDQSVILGGEANYMSRCENSVILGGEDNIMAYSIQSCFILGGDSNKIFNNSFYSGMIGSRNCNIGHSSFLTVMIAAYSCTAKGIENTLISGVSNKAVSCENGADGIFMSGGGGFARLSGQKTQADGFFSMVGDAQVSDLVMKAETATDAQLPLSLSQWPETFIPLTSPNTLKFEIDVVARQTGGTAGAVTDSAMWKITGGIKNTDAELSTIVLEITGGTTIGETIDILYGTMEATIAFVDPETYEFGTNPWALPVRTTMNGVSSWLEEFFERKFPHFILAEDKYMDETKRIITITAHPDIRDLLSTISITSSAANISVVGDGSFSPLNTGTVSFVGAPNGTGVSDTGDHDPTMATQGTITMSGLPVADETFVIDDQTFTWKAARSTTGEVTIGADAAECVTNIVTAVGLDLTSVTAEDGDGDTVIVTADTIGSSGNSIAFEALTTVSLTEPVTAKSVILDFADNWGEPDRMGIRSVDFWSGGAKIELGTTDFTAYASSEYEYDTNHPVENAFDTSLSKIGVKSEKEWFSADDIAPGNINQRIIVVFNTEKTFDEIRINNSHDNGTYPTYGVKNTKIYHSDSAVSDTDCGAGVSTSDLIFEGQLSQHSAVNEEDEQTPALVSNDPTTNMAVDGSGTLGGTTVGKDGASAWEVDVEADDTNKGLAIKVTGEADRTIHWVAKVNLVEVG